MPSFCVAFRCGNRSCHAKCVKEGISFHRFPLKNRELLNQWIANIGRQDFHPSEHSKICSVHFREDDFTYQPFTNRRLLKPDSVPTIFSFEKAQKKRKRPTIRKRNSSEEGVLMDACNHFVPADLASSSTSETQEMNDSSEDSQGKMYIIRCNPQNGVEVKKIESDGTESVVPSYVESAQGLSDLLPSHSIPCRKRKACESCDEASERRHREKMQKWDRFLYLMEELVETCKSKNSDKPNLDQNQSAGENFPMIAEKLKQFVGLVSIGKQSAYVKFELVD